MERRTAAFLSALVGAVSLAAFVPPAARAQNLDDIFRRVNPSVIVVRSRGHDVGAGGISRFKEIGSGVLISDTGRVMTAAHVVNGMDEITVEGVAGEVVRAQLVSSDADADIALLQLERVTAAMRVAQLGNSDTVRVGQQVMVVGAPYGLAHSMSVGWISARWPPNSIFPDMPLAEFFQTTATINTGNSGGPMFNMAGEVVAIVSQNITKSGGSEGLGFAVTINTAQKLLIDRKVFWAALQGILISGDLAAILNVPPPGAGFLVRTVAQGSIAANMGVVGGDRTVSFGGREIALGGDIILSVEGITVSSEANIEKIRTTLAGMPRNAPFKMTVLRAGKILELTGSGP
jgi:S1-C subfamily serine protease